MSDFHPFAALIKEQFDEMSKGELFTTAAQPDARPGETMNDHYTIKLCDGKYTLIRRFGQGLELLRHGEAWPGADDLRFCNVLIAAAERIQELEEAVKAVLDGTLITGDVRNDDGMRNFDIYTLHRVADWEGYLRKVLEQKS